MALSTLVAAGIPWLRAASLLSLWSTSSNLSLLCCHMTFPFVYINSSPSKQTGVPGFQMFTLLNFTFMKDLHWYLFSLSERNLKRIFTFMKKRQKEKIAFGVCFAAESLYKGIVHPEPQEWSCQALPWEHLQVKLL